MFSVETCFSLLFSFSLFSLLQTEGLKPHTFFLFQDSEVMSSNKSTILARRRSLGAKRSTNSSRVNCFCLKCLSFMRKNLLNGQFFSFIATMIWAMTLTSAKVILPSQMMGLTTSRGKTLNVRKRILTWIIFSGSFPYRTTLKSIC